MRSRCVLRALPRHPIEHHHRRAQPEVQQDRRRQQRDVIAGCAIDLHEMAVTIRKLRQHPQPA